MSYNQFTIDYIESLKRNLNIYINENGEPIYLPDQIMDKDILNLKNELQEIWKNSVSSIEVIRSKNDSIIQSGLFGLVSEFETALKVGFLIGDRVVLIDYLFERVLLKKAPNKVNREHLGSIANSLVSVLPLAQAGRVVIIPNPFNWNYETKKIIDESSTKTALTPELISMLNMLSITKTCNLHPYTIAESDINYTNIIKNQIDQVDLIGKDGGQFAYEGILGALLSEKLLNEVEFNYALNVPISKYFEIISSNKDFYLKYLSHITSGTSFNAQNNIDKIRNDLLKDIKENNKILSKVADTIIDVGSLASGVISLFLGSASVISAPLAITNAALGFSSTLCKVLNNKKKEEELIISVFKKLNKAGGQK